MNSPRTIGYAIAAAATLCAHQLSAGATTPLRITEVATSSSVVEVTNLSTAAYVVAADMYFSHGNNTASTIPASTTFTAGESKLFTVAGLDQNDSDLWLFRDANFTDPASLESGLKYGPAANVGRTSLAVSAGIWPSPSAFVPVPGAPATDSLRLTAHSFTSETAWGAGAPNPGAYFGTGTTIANPLPPVQKGTETIDLQEVATGLVAPLGLAVPDDGSNRIFVYDQGGTVTLILNGVQQSTTVLDVSQRLMKLGLFPPLNYDERGLLGVACHPNFAANRKIYTFTTEPLETTSTADFTAAPGSITDPAFGFDHQNVIAEWQMSVGDPNVVNVSTRRELMRINHPQFNHDGGTLRFGPDGMLYISIGDGGQGNDVAQGHISPNGNAQDLGVVFGKILRIDVDGTNSTNGKYGVPPDNPFVLTPAAVAEIYAYGLRNPYAFSFDQVNGELWVGDAGQNKIEEASKITAGANCGWNVLEGTFYFDKVSGQVKTIPARPVPANVVNPVAQYDRDDGSVIIGGFVYRGSAIPSLVGRYITGDFGGFFAPTGRLFFIDAGNAMKELRITASDVPLNQWLKGFGQDAAGEVYICTSTVLGPFGTTGKVIKLVPQGSRVGEWELY